MGLAGTIASWFGAASRPPGEGEGAVPGEQKSIATVAGTLVFTGGGDGAFVERSYAALARGGFMQNPVAYRSVRLISEAAAAIPLVLHDGDSEVSGHRLLELLRRPNPMTDGAAFVEAICGHLLLSGNAYVEAALIDGEVRALHLLRPDRVRLIEGVDGWPEAYEYRAGASVRPKQLEVSCRGRGSVTWSGVRSVR